MRNLVRVLVILSAVLCCMIPSWGQAKQERVVLVTLEGVSLNQLVRWQIPEFLDLVNSGGIGMMNDRTLGPLCFANNAVTISAGTRASGSRSDIYRTIDEASLAFNSTEQSGQGAAGETFAINSGLSADRKSVVHLGAESIKAMNLEQYYTILPGRLGSLLRKSGIDTYVFGNSDHDGIQSRDAAAIAIDEHGLISGGDVSGRTNVKDPTRPASLRTDFGYILARIGKCDCNKSFTVVEAGDGGRIVSVEPYLSPEQDDRYKKHAAEECFRFVKALDSTLKLKYQRHLVILAVTSADYAASQEGDLLTPVMMVGTGVKQGLLTSQTTRRSGFVANYDITSTVLSFFEIPSDPTMMGRPLVVKQHESALPLLQATYSHIVDTDAGRSILMRGFIYTLSVLAVLSAILLLLGNSGKRAAAGRILRPLRSLTVGIMMVPLAFLLAPGFRCYGSVSAGLFTLAFAFISGWILNSLISDTRLLLAVVGIATAAVVGIDLVLGAKLLEQSALSYSVVAGARYYGIGNEYSGVLLGSLLLGIFALADRYGDRIRHSLVWISLLYMITFVLLGSPQFGTKFGGMVATIAGFSVAIVKMRGGRLLSKKFLTIIGGGVVLLAVVIGLNMALAPSKQTHIGHIFSQAQTSGPGIFVETALRKWAMNFKLMRYSNWAIALISMVLSLIVVVSRPVNGKEMLRSDHPIMAAGFSGILAVAIAAFLTNDAGVVMASTTLLYLVLPLILLLESKKPLPLP